jgi:hypothetical protein
MAVVRDCGNEPSAIFDPAAHSEYERCLTEKVIDERFAARCVSLSAINPGAFEACVRGRSSPSKFMEEAEKLAEKAREHNTAPQAPKVEKNNTILYIALVAMFFIVIYTLKTKKD